MTKKPEYKIQEGCFGRLSDSQLKEVLDKLPFSVTISEGHTLSLTSRVSIDADEDPILLVDHQASVISLRPPQGKRLSDACFYGNREVFSPSRVMDECTGGGACCSYSFSTGKLGLPYDYSLMLDIYKLG